MIYLIILFTTIFRTLDSNVFSLFLHQNWLLQISIFSKALFKISWQWLEIIKMLNSIDNIKEQPAESQKYLNV